MQQMTQNSVAGIQIHSALKVFAICRSTIDPRPVVWHLYRYGLKLTAFAACVVSRYLSHSVCRVEILNFKVKGQRHISRKF